VASSPHTCELVHNPSIPASGRRLVLAHLVQTRQAVFAIDIFDKWPHDHRFFRIHPPTQRPFCFRNVLRFRKMVSSEALLAAVPLTHDDRLTVSVPRALVRLWRLGARLCSTAPKHDGALRPCSALFPRWPGARLGASIAILTERQAVSRSFTPPELLIRRLGLWNGLEPDGLSGRGRRTDGPPRLARQEWPSAERLRLSLLIFQNPLARFFFRPRGVGLRAAAISFSMVKPCGALFSCSLPQIAPIRSVPTRA
jgi:hypothetical protein